MDRWKVSSSLSKKKNSSLESSSTLQNQGKGGGFFKALNVIFS